MDIGHALGYFDDLGAIATRCQSMLDDLARFGGHADQEWLVAATTPLRGIADDIGTATAGIQRVKGQLTDLYEVRNASIAIDAASEGQQLIQQTIREVEQLGAGSDGMALRLTNDAFRSRLELARARLQYASQAYAFELG